jgi:hypothetical protein
MYFDAPALPDQDSDGQIVRTYVTTWFYRFLINKTLCWSTNLAWALDTRTRVQETFIDARTLLPQVHGQLGNDQSIYLIQVPDAISTNETLQVGQVRPS